MPDSKEPTVSDHDLQRPNEGCLQADPKRGVIRLSADESERFVRSLLEEPPISPALQRAARLHRRLIDPS